MEYEYETDEAITERLEVIAKSFYILNKNIERLTDMLEDKLGGFDENNLNVTLYTDKPIMVTNQSKEEK